MGPAVAGQMLLKVVNKPLNDLIWYFLIFRAKERTPGESYLFFTILEVKDQEQAERIRKGNDQVSWDFKLVSSTLWLCTDTALALSLLCTWHLQVAIDRPQLGDYCA
uniref:Uncharacterized protein n=1 Tax=Solanum tuberosum TaxID=4113 RepID=M1DNS3_SOLTU